VLFAAKDRCRWKAPHLQRPSVLRPSPPPDALTCTATDDTMLSQCGRSTVHHRATRPNTANAGRAHVRSRTYTHTHPHTLPAGKHFAKYTNHAVTSGFCSSVPNMMHDEEDDGVWSCK
jgi:hypothetical protein